jgi:RNA processing factor Prp31
VPLNRVNEYPKRALCISHRILSGRTVSTHDGDARAVRDGVGICRLRGQTPRCRRLTNQGRPRLDHRLFKVCQDGLPPQLFPVQERRRRAREHQRRIRGCVWRSYRVFCWLTRPPGRPGILNDQLKSLLELNLSKGGKKSPKVKLIVHDAPLANAILDGTGLKCDASEDAQEILRGIRQHAHKLLKGLDANDLVKAQLGLGHSYSRAKLKFNVNRVDNMIIQAIALLDQLDKDVNLFAMRIREWYGYHFPELIKLVSDNYQYARLAQFIGDKDTLSEEKLPELATIIDDNATLAQNILDAARGSMGSSISDIDMLNISAFAARVVSIADYRKSLVAYLAEKMNLVAPSLTALLGERIGARLISHAGSLTNLSKYPASTVQILGAEKALFRALKTKGNTPKVSEAARHRYRSHVLISRDRSTASCTTPRSSVAPSPNTRAEYRGSSQTSVRSHRG